jgi:hypothetical protein
MFSTKTGIRGLLQAVVVSSQTKSAVLAGLSLSCGQTVRPVYFTEAGRCRRSSRDQRGFVMTQLLERAFAEAGKLSSDEQDLLASRVLAELTDEDEFDHAIAASADKLAMLANKALAEHRAGQTQELSHFPRT